MPRVKDPVWNFFNSTVKEGNKGLWATCKKCKMEFQGIVPQMKKNLEICSPSDTVHIERMWRRTEEKFTIWCRILRLNRSWTTTSTKQGTSAATLAAEAEHPPTKIPRMQPKLPVGRDHAVIQTSPRYVKEISTQIAKFFNATNTPFYHADNKEFIKTCNMLRPGFKPSM